MFINTKGPILFVLQAVVRLLSNSVRLRPILQYLFSTCYGINRLIDSILGFKIIIIIQCEYSHKWSETETGHMYLLYFYWFFYIFYKLVFLGVDDD